MQLTAIDWPWPNLYTLNPVVGCARGCTWGKGECYAARMNRRFHFVPDFTKPVFFPARLKQKVKAGSHVFVGSMSDIEYWHRTWTRNIIDYCRMHPTVSFYFLSKNPLAYTGYDWPDNCCLGLTMTLTQTEQCQYENMSVMIRHKRCFLSLEPLLGELKITGMLHMLEKIIVGAMTGPGAVRPLPAWIDSIKRLNLDNVYWKANIKSQAQ